jgi:hypothetical protein
VAELVNVAEYVPSPLSVTDPNDPDVVDRATVPLLEVSLLPWASSACTVIVDVDVPFALIDVGEAVIVLVDADTGPGVRDTDVGIPIAVPAIVPVMIAAPVAVPLVNVAV